MFEARARRPSVTESVELEFQKIEPKQTLELAILTLNRPEKSNALNKDMIDRLLLNLQRVAERPSCRALILRANGKNFCAGADLAWMKASAELSSKDNLSDVESLAEVFERLHNLDVPVLAVVQGLAYGGALGLIACCDLVIAEEEARFSLREVKIGLIPAMILPYLQKKVQATALKYLSITGATCSAQEAKEMGLITKTCRRQDVTHDVRNLLNELFEGGPQAQVQLKKLFKRLSSKNFEWAGIRADCVKTIAELRASEEGQKGLGSFFNKEKPHWVGKLTESWTLHD